MKIMPQNALIPGFQLHWYTIESVLGYGGFGITYLARDINLDKLVAIKEYLPAEFSYRDTANLIRANSDENKEIIDIFISNLVT